jgi:chemotaxis protein methyltransferase CheR
MAAHESAHGHHRASLTHPIALPDGPFVLLRDLIVQRTGVMFDDLKRALLADKLSALVIENGFTSFLDYYYLLRYDPGADAHWAQLLDRLAVPETYFWRQSDQFVSLAETIAPSHATTHPGQPLRIWSAACCTGEEPVSIAIAMAEAGLLDSGKVQIRGSDASALMIERARSGSYGERSFRQLPPALRDRWFEPHGERWRPVERIRNAIRYDVVNLARPDEIAPLAQADVIFCRNVFIYFADDAIRTAVRAFAENIAADGYLYLGAAESLTRLGVDFELAEVGGAFAYVRTGRRSVVERPAPGVMRAKA